MKKFENVSANPNNPKWNNIIKRQQELYSRKNDLRNDFERDYTRIIHCPAYRRLKHKTQVFFSPDNDHICTRIEHVTTVDSISHTISNYLGLNNELTKAIAVAHDIGHSPFGHEGERILSEISERDIGTRFWHEKNGLHIVDDIELLEDNRKNMQNLNLTYAVRDGIISHCGEIDENSLKPREECIDLSNYTYPNEYAPYTWEGCVVKVSDKISFIGRDIEDAITLGILDKNLSELYKLLDVSGDDEPINNTVIINYLISDLCENSSPEVGLHFSDKAFNLMNSINAFNYKNIYKSDKLSHSPKYFRLIINEIYDMLKSAYEGEKTIDNLKELQRYYPKLGYQFIEFMNFYYDFGNRDELKLKNKVLFSIDNKSDYCKCIIYFISGMTDNYAIELYNEIIRF